MNSRTDDLSALQTQLAEKQDLVVVLTAQLEKTVTQLDRLKRSGMERQNSVTPGMLSSDQSELHGKLMTAVEEWQEIEPAGRIMRIEEGIERILDLLQTQPSTVAASSTSESSEAPVPDFWEAAKARLLGDEVASKPVATSPSSIVGGEGAGGISDAIPAEREFSEGDFAQAGTAPPAPGPLSETRDPDELIAAVNTRDVYIQHLTARLRLAESRKYLPVNWEQISSAPDQYRHRLESLETLLQDHLRQAEVAHSLERALLARERAKLAQIKHNLEQQIKRMAPPPPPSLSPPVNEVPETPMNAETDRRWKRIFSR